MDDPRELDQRLARSALGGDESAFAELVSRHQRLVAGVAWRYGARPEEVEDLVSEVFIKVFRNLHRYRPEHSFSTWLYRLAANHVLDHGRRRRREGLRAEMPQEIVDSGPIPAETLEQRERAGLLRRALEEVSPRYRETLLVVYVDGLQVQQAASMLDLPVGTVKTRLMRGREALRKILTRRHPEHFGKP